MRKKNKEYPCHKLPKNQRCDHSGPGGFMGHTCIEQKPTTEQNYIGERRAELTDKEIEKSLALVKEKIEMRLLQKQRGAYIGNHETYGILSEEFNKELLDALKANDNEQFYCELIDIAVGAILGMASMYANKQQALKDR